MRNLLDLVIVTGVCTCVVFLLFSSSGGWLTSLSVRLRMSEDTTAMVRLKRTGHDPVDVQKGQVSPMSVGRIFSVSQKVTLVGCMYYLA